MHGVWWAVVCAWALDWDARYLMVSARFEKGEFAAAEKELTPLLEEASTAEARAKVYHLLAGVHHQTGRGQSALAHYRQALEAWPPDHPNRATTLLDLGYLYMGLTEFALAEPLIADALALHEKHFGVSHPHTAVNLLRLADLYLVTGRAAAAQPLLTRALKAFAPGSREWVSIRLTQVRQMTIELRDADAFRALEEVDQLCRDPADCGAALAERGGLYRLRADWVRARPVLKRALAQLETAHGREHVSLPTVLFDLALTEVAEGKLSAAASFLDRAEAIARRTQPAYHFIFALLDFHRARIALLRHDYARARGLLADALPVMEERFPADHPELVAARLVCAAVAAAEGDTEEAQRRYAQVSSAIGPRDARSYLSTFGQGGSPEAKRVNRFVQRLR